MGQTTVDDYLTYIPVGGYHRGLYLRSGSKTTMPSNPRDLDGVEISTWESFVETVHEQRTIALNSKSEKELFPLYEEEHPIKCENESQVEHALLTGLFGPLRRLMLYLGFPGDFVVRPHMVTLDPDYSWESEMRKDSTERSSPDTAVASSIDTILVEVKTFWEFNPPDDLVPILELEMSSSQPQAEQSVPPAKRSKKDDPGDMGKVVIRAVSQIYGYMF
ncbi:unnamed protein product [Calypogeia fissa]